MRNWAAFVNGGPVPPAESTTPTAPRDWTAFVNGPTPSAIAATPTAPALGPLASAWAGLKHGAKGVGIGAEQAIAHGLSTLPFLGGASQVKEAQAYWDREASQGASQYAQQTRAHPYYADAGNLVGSALPLLPFGGGEVAGAADAIKAGMGVGALAGATQPVTGGNYAEGKLGQIALGTVGGGIGGTLGPILAKLWPGSGVAPSEIANVLDKAPVTAQVVQDAVQKGQSINPEAVMRQAEAERLPFPVHLTPGMATDNQRLISEEMNRRAVTPGAVENYNYMNNQLARSVHNVFDRVAPEGTGSDQEAIGSHLIDAIQSRLTAHQKATSDAYQAVQDALGPEPLVDGPAFGKNAQEALKNDLHGDFIDPKIQQLVGQFAEGSRQMTPKNFESLRTILARASRGPDGTAAHAAGIVRSTLEDMPAEGRSGEIKALADHARSLAKQGFALRESLPAVRAVDADVGTAGRANPSKFVRQFLVNGKPEDVANLHSFLSGNPTDVKAIQAGLVSHLRDSALSRLPDQPGLPEDVGKMSQANYNKALGLLKSKIGATLPQPEAETLQRIGNVAKWVQNQGAGSYVNNANTAVAALAHAGTRGIASAIDGVTGFPIGSIGHDAVSRMGDKILSRSRLSALMAPGAGIASQTYQDSPLSRKVGSVALASLLAQTPGGHQ